MIALREHLTFGKAGIVTETLDEGNGKSLYMKGIFIQGDVVNENGRNYPTHEISSAVKNIQQRISEGYSVLGEADHPDDLQVNIDRVSHMITDMSMKGSDGIGKLKILPTPMGNICKTMREAGVKLGVSSRGSGNVGNDGKVSDFEIITVDIVANPSAPNAYPDPIYENIMKNKRKNILLGVAEALGYDVKAQKHLQKEVLRFIQDLKY